MSPARELGSSYTAETSRGQFDPADVRVVPVIFQGRTMLPARFVAE
jgi:hypothetical protein